MKKNAFLFPGQGAQYPSMGKDFYQAFPVARSVFIEADDLLKENLSKLIFEGPEKELTETKNSQLAIYVTSIAILKVIENELPELKPNVCAGLSLGEYTALLASGKIDFAQGLSLVQKRAYFMNEACIKHPGTMAAVLGLDAETLFELTKDKEGLWVANCNCPNQVVISGKKDAIENITPLLKEHGARRVLPIQVHGAFHSGLMQMAQDKLANFIEKASIKESSIDLVMNVPGKLVTSTQEIKENLLKQVTSPVMWEKGIRSIFDKDLYLEIGPGKTLSSMNKKIGVHGKILSVEKVEDLKNLLTYYQETLSGC